MALSGSSFYQLPFTIPSDKTYAVIEVPKEEGPYSSAVPLGWLHDLVVITEGEKIVKIAKCHWPVDEKNLGDWVNRNKKPEPKKTNRWMVYNDVRVLRLCRSLSGAKKKSDDAANQSNISSQSEAENSQKRTRKPRQMFDPSLYKAKALEDATTESSNDDSDSDSTIEELEIKKRKTDVIGPAVIKEGAASQGALEALDVLNIPDTSMDARVWGNVVDLDNGPESPGDPQQLSSVNREGTKNGEELGAKDIGELGAKDGELGAKDGELGAKDGGELGAKDGELGAKDGGELGAKDGGKLGAKDGGKLGTKDGGKLGAKDGEKPEEKEGDNIQTAPISNAQVTRTSPTNWKSVGTASSVTAAAGGGRQLGVPSPLRRNLFSSTRVASPQKNLQAKNDAYIIKVLERLEYKMDKIALAVCPELEVSQSKSKKNKNIPSLPLEDENSVAGFRTFLLDEHNMAIVVNLLANHGSVTGRETIYGILRKLMSNKLAEKYNFKGKNRCEEGAQKTGKKAFEKTQLYDLVIAAAKRQNDKLTKPAGGVGFACDKKTLDAHIMAWLKDAPKRVKQEEKKKATECSVPVVGS